MPEPSYWALVCRSSQTPNHWIASLLRLEIFARIVLCHTVGSTVLCHTTEAAQQTSVASGRYLCVSDATIRAVNKQIFGGRWARTHYVADSLVPLFVGEVSVFACFTHRQQWPMHYPIRLFMSFVIPTIRYQPRDTPVTSLRNVSIIFELHRMNLELMDARRSLFARPK